MRLMCTRVNIDCRKYVVRRANSKSACPIPIATYNCERIINKISISKLREKYFPFVSTKKLSPTVYTLH